MKPRSLLPFATIVFWLLAWPLQGPLLHGGPPEMQLFLVAHTIALLLTGIALNSRRLRQLQALALPGAIIATAGYQLTNVGAGGWLLLAGICSALLMVRAGCLLSSDSVPLRQAATGLLLANLAFLLLILIDSQLLQTILVLMLMPLAVGKTEQPPRGQQHDLFYYLPLLACYHLVAGLMYAQMLPSYQHAAWWPGAELFFYLAMVATALKTRTEGDLRLVAAFLTATTALVLHSIGGRTGINLAMFAMQAAAGLVDVFALELMLTQHNPLIAFSYGCAAVTGGIFTGEWLGRLLTPRTGLASMFGILALNLTLALLYLLSRHRGAVANSRKRQLFRSWQPTPVLSPDIPPEWQVLLAPREQKTLLGVMAGLTYREIAQEMAVSSSTVKTYMQRIYVKTGCSCQKDLLNRIAAEQNRRP